MFILCTGRCGSTTFIRACSHITNFTSGHETKVHELGMRRVQFPAQHIEADHYLSWFLGKLDREYGDSAKYAHLIRDSEAVAASFSERRHWIGSLPTAYQLGIMKNSPKPFSDICRDQVETVNTNIQHFLKDKSHTMEFRLEHAQDHWPKFWSWIGAEGNYQASLAEWNVRHNATKPLINRKAEHVAQRVMRAWRALFPK